MDLEQSIIRFYESGDAAADEELTRCVRVHACARARALFLHAPPPRILSRLLLLCHECALAGKRWPPWLLHYSAAPCNRLICFNTSTPKVRREAHNSHGVASPSLSALE